jgi:hypothetical protein
MWFDHVLTVCRQYCWRQEEQGETMKTIQIKEASWHYRFLDFMKLDPWYVNDFCHYIRKFIAATLLLVGVVLVTAGFGFITGDMLSWLAWMLVNLQWVYPSDWAVVALAFWGLAVLIATMAVSVIGYGKLPPDTQEIIGAAWESIHDKVCFRVKVIPDRCE